MDPAKLDEIFLEYLDSHSSIFLPKDVVTFTSCVEYLRNESEFWKKREFHELAEHFRTMTAILENAEATDSEANIRNACRDVSNTLRTPQRSAFSSKLPKGMFIGQLADHDREMAGAAMAYYDGTLHRRHPLNARTFDGAMAAALFEHPEFASIGLAGRVAELEREIRRAQTLGQEAADALNTSKLANQVLVGGATEQLNALITKATSDFGMRQASIEDEHRKSKAEKEAEMADIRQSFENLKKSYGEQLSLKEPAAYWKSLKDGYQRQSVWLGGGAILVVGILGGSIAYLLYYPPDLLTKTSDQFGYIKGALLVGGGLSTLIYLLNLFVRLSTSALHLSRDARERYQLTRVYLALVAQGTMNEKDREIVLASLFSRADTGLLKDGAPTVTTPLGAAIDKLTGK